MSNPLFFAFRQFGGRKNPLRPKALAEHEFALPSATIFLVMRKMRVPLIVLIVVFSISVVGLALIPGVDADGNPVRMTLFDSFYVMSYTATTIGFGEIPLPFTVAQRIWVTFSIYLSVIGWAYAIGSLLTLISDSGFRRALSVQRFTRTVARSREPFLLLAGYGQTGRLLVKAFDALGQRVVVVDKTDRRIEALDLEPLHADVPGLVADAASPHLLTLAGLGHRHCAGVLALTDDDEANLTISVTAALLRPDLPVFTRTASATIADRARAFGTPTVVDPFDVFGDHLRLALSAPSTFQLLEWLEGGPGAELPSLGKLPPDGRWVLCGFGRFGKRLMEDFRAAGIEVTIIEPNPGDDVDVIQGDAADRDVLEKAKLDSAIGVVAGTDNDTTNLSILANARHLNPKLYLAARQNKPSSTALFRAMDVDSLLVPTEVVAHQVYAQISTPLLWRFLKAAPAKGDAWAAGVVERLRGHCGMFLPALWAMTLDAKESPAIANLLASDEVSLGDLLRDPVDRDHRLDAVPLLLSRDGDVDLCPADDVRLEMGDALLFAGTPHAHRELELTTVNDSTAAYVLFDRHVPDGLVWRKLSQRYRPIHAARGEGREDRVHPR